MGGVGPDTFAPDRPVSRQELATLLWRSAGSPADFLGELEDFADGDRAAQYARWALTWAVDKGLLRGSGGLLDPEGPATRAQCAQVLVRFLELVQTEYS